MKTHLQKLTFSLIPLVILGYNLMNAQQTEFYGMTLNGGDYSAGSIFRTDANGDNISVLYDFFAYDGTNPSSSLCLANNGKLYGMTSYGGKYMQGVLFEWDPVNNIYTKKLDLECTNMGCQSRGTLIQGQDGILYGTTEAGGIFNYGVLFGWNPVTGEFVKYIDFDGENCGANPQGNLLQAKNGKIYGMTCYGGSFDKGILFEWNPATGDFIKRLDFNGIEKGKYPNGSLVQTEKGRFFGMTTQGGLYDLGVLFEWDPSTSNFTKKIDFNGAGNGNHPCGTLMEIKDGKLFGTTAYGGINDVGVLFQWDPNLDFYMKMHDFSREEEMAFPRGTLIQSKNGKVFGTTNDAIYEWDPETNNITKKFHFDSNQRENGVEPNGTLVQAHNGKLYGLTHEGGGAINCNCSGSGVLFEWDLSTDSYSKKLSFGQAENGKRPSDRLTLANNGKLYGLTNSGGVYDNGVLFEWNPLTHAFTKKIDFDGREKGGHPLGSLINASNGKLYGMTQNGGENRDDERGIGGVLFEWDPATDTYTKKLDFNGTDNGSQPYGSLIQADNGKLYGMTSRGGNAGAGVLFEWNPSTNVYIKKHDFSNDENGAVSYGNLVQANNGKLYGMTHYGGLYNYGVLFEWDPVTNTYEKKVDFNGAVNGRNPEFGSLVQADNGKLYGLTTSGGTSDYGVLFEWDPTSDYYVKKVDFNGVDNGKYPLGFLMKAKNGKIYGTASKNVSNDNGILFEWDPFIDVFTIKYCYENVSTGKDDYTIPVFKAQESLVNITDAEKSILKSDVMIMNTKEKIGKVDLPAILFSGCLTEVNCATYSIISIETCNYYRSPSGRYAWMNTGIYSDTISNARGCDSIITIHLTINPTPNPPLAKDLATCEGDMSTTLQATGNNIKWYSATDSLYDSRDGKKYNTVRIANQFWMADNLDIGTQINGTLDQANNTIFEKYCYDNDPGNCNLYGALYQWNELMNYSTQESTQGICPTGWHVPSNQEWKELEIDLGMYPSEADSLDLRGSDQGTKLIAGGTSGFNALMAGKRTPAGTFANLNSYTTFWNSTGSDRTLSTSFPGIYAAQADNKSNGFSLRCVSNDSALLALGNTLNTGHLDPGIYNYQVTQTVNGCESPAATVALTINSHPAPPVANNVTVCEGEPVPELSAAGENIQWYSDIGLTTRVDTGASFETGQTEPGMYSYFVTQTVSGCESVAGLAELTINPLPVIDLGEDTTIYPDQGFILGPFSNDYSYLWSDGSENPYYEVSGEDIGLGTHQILVIVSDINGCTNSDTVVVSIIPYSGINLNQKDNRISLFPNPTNGSFTIDLGCVYSNVVVTLTSPDGRIVQSEERDYTQVIDLKINAQPGIYLVTITSGNERAVFKIVKN